MDAPVIGQYEIKDGLGRGAMGSVYLAHDAKMGRDVAIKILQKEFAQSSKHRTRFEREARAIAALHHPNIVEIYDYGGSPDDHLYLVMEYIAGPHVGALVREHGVFTESILCAIGVELTAALSHAHKAGIIHRDLKPENVFIDKGRLVLADFGIVKAITEDNPLGAAAASPKTDVIGTPGFMAPEQLLQEPLDTRADIFSLGALLYYLAALKLPYDAESPYALLKEFRETRPTPLSDIRPDFSDAVSRVVQDCLEVERDYRPKDVQAVSKQLRAALDDVGARDVRELLASYESNAAAFTAVDKRRTVAHLVEQLKIAVRDQDGVRADTIRNRIGVLDPGNAEAQRITGTEQVLRRKPRETAPELVLSRAKRRQRAFWVVGALVAALGLAAMLFFHEWTGRPEPGPTTLIATDQSFATLRVRANERTHVFLDGRALGSTPNFQPTSVPSGIADVELVTDSHGRMTETVELKPDTRVTLVVDWKRGKVRVKTAPTKGKKK